MSLPLVLSVMVGSSLLIQTEWARLRCAHALFESTHEAMTGTIPSRRYLETVILTEEGAHGQSGCEGGASLFLPSLESAQW